MEPHGPHEVGDQKLQGPVAGASLSACWQFLKASVPRCSAALRGAVCLLCVWARTHPQGSDALCRLWHCSVEEFSQVH